MRIRKVIGLSLTTLGLLTGCLWGQEKLSMGVTPGPHERIMEYVKTQAKAEGLDIKLVEFSDFILPNAALDEGDIDVNSYQHQLFLDDQVKSRGYKLVSIGKTILLPMGIYSKKLKDLSELKEKSKVAIPNDPTNGGRALLLLEKKSLLKLKARCGHMPSVLDIDSNSMKLKIIELEAPQIPRAIEDVAIAVVNTDWALLAGLGEAIAHEDLDSPYANVIVVREKDKDDPRFKKLLNIYHSKETAAFIEKEFGQAVIPAW